jgi:hypothetical protein
VADGGSGTFGVFGERLSSGVVFKAFSSEANQVWHNIDKHSARHRHQMNSQHSDTSFLVPTDFVLKEQDLPCV